MQVSIYKSSDHDRIPWPDTTEGQKAKSWLSPLLSNGIEPYIRNVHTEPGVIVYGDHIIPFTSTEPYPHNSYVCSPFTHYITYGREELHKLDSRFMKVVFGWLLNGMQRWFAWAEFDRVLYVNNWLLSTNLYPELEMNGIDTIHKALLAEFSDRPIVFRSVDKRANPELYNTLLYLGYKPVFSRYVWYQDPSTEKVQKRKSYKQDRSIARRSGYEVVDGNDLNDLAFDRVEELYNKLYLDKYSTFNPQFTSDFIRHLCRAGILHIRALCKDGRMDGVLGFYTRRGIGTAPLFGYDTSLPAKAGLYRILSWVWAEEAKKQGLLINCSAGVGQFKKNRGAEPALESNMVFADHVPRVRRCWTFMRFLLTWVGVPIIRKHEL